MRTAVRTRESAVLAVAALIGVASGLLVAAMRQAAQTMHEVFFQLPAGAALSVTIPRESWRVIAVPTLGGVILAGLALWVGQRFRGRQADAIEANALHGGRLSTAEIGFVSPAAFAAGGEAIKSGRHAIVHQSVIRSIRV